MQVQKKMDQAWRFGEREWGDERHKVRQRLKKVWIDTVVVEKVADTTGNWEEEAKEILEVREIAHLHAKYSQANM